MAFFDTKDESELYTAEEIQQNKVVCIFAYFGFMFFIPLVAAQQSGYGKFHANQGLVLFILEAALGVISSVISLFAGVPAIGFMAVIFSSILTSVGGFIATVLSIVGIVNVAQGRARELPVIGGIRIIK